MSWFQLGAAALIVAIGWATYFGIRWGYRIQRQLGQVLAAVEVDPLTGVGSRRAFDSFRWFAALRSGQPLCVGVFEIDRLDRIRCGQGEQSSTAALRAAAQALTLGTRRGCDEIFLLDAEAGRFLVLQYGSLSPAKVAANLRSCFRRFSVLLSGCLAYTSEITYQSIRQQLKALAEAGCAEAQRRGGDCILISYEGILRALRRSTLPARWWMRRLSPLRRLLRRSIGAQCLSPSTTNPQPGLCALY
jgi:hypothetical protein